MITKNTLDNQLHSISMRFRMFGRAEIKELRKILRPEEVIVQCAYGYYQGGSGVLVLTEERLLLVDKRPFFVNVENVAFETIRDIDFVARSLQGTLYLHAGMKRLVFRSISDARLRHICEYIQNRISEIEKPLVAVIPIDSTNQVSKNPYPALWSTRHAAFLPRPRPSKFYPKISEPVAR